MCRDLLKLFWKHFTGEKSQSYDTGFVTVDPSGDFAVIAQQNYNSGPSEPNTPRMDRN